MSSMPSFDDAYGRFRAFLADQGIAGEPQWVFREDCVRRGRRVYVRVPLPAVDSNVIRAYYERAARHGRGVVIEILCLLDERPCCFLWAPASDEEAQHAMVSGLKLSVPATPTRAHAVGSALRWRLLSHCAAIADVPPR